MSDVEEKGKPPKKKAKTVAPKKLSAPVQEDLRKIGPVPWLETANAISKNLDQI